MPARKKTTPEEEQAELAGLFEPYVWDWFERAFAAPSPPQVAAWPKIAERANTLIFSPTGSGKTLAAFLWCLNALFQMGREGTLEDAVYVLYVSPLKALNNDIQKNLVRPLRGIRRAAKTAGLEVPTVRSRVRTGDTPQGERIKMVRRPPHILITTPESLFIILSTPKFREAFRQVRYVIVDEIHAISDNKRGVQLSLSLERLQHLAGAPFVRIGCSATQKPLEEIAGFLAGCGEDGRPRPCEIVDIGARKELNVHAISPVDNLLEAHFDAIWGSAYEQMISLVQGHDTTLIFTNSRYKTERTALRLNELSADRDIRVGAHHGSMSKEVRLDAENRLKKGELDALVATSSLELGIDVGSIDLVCQVESPRSVSRGLQRIGRAGHLLDATSEGRLLVTDRDDLVESAVLVRAILDGRIDSTRIPTNCLDVLAQHVVGAVAADDWDADELYALCRGSYCFRDLTKRDYRAVLEMLSGDYPFEAEQLPFPKISWDRVNNVLAPERAARLIAYRASGTIPDTADYDVWFEEKKTRVGTLDEGFIEQLRPGDIFILGSSAWQVTGFSRNRVMVKDVYGRAPTIPFWTGERDSRTAGLGRLVGEFRRKMAGRLGDEDVLEWLQREYCVDENGAQSIHEYFREQHLSAGCVPCDRMVLLESFTDELGQRQIVIHSSFGIRVNETWAMALARVIEREHGVRVQTATVDDGILITQPAKSEFGPDLLEQVAAENVQSLIEEAVVDSPVFSSRFRHNAVRSLLVLREYQGRRTPVWLQSLRASALLDACRKHATFPPVAETLRECMSEALDLPELQRVLQAVESGEIEVKAIESEVPSPFCHSLLLVGQYGDFGAIPTRERRSRLIHLHRELLKQILDEETLRNLLDPAAVAEVEARVQRTAPDRLARDANELARVLGELGDLVDMRGDETSLDARTEGGAASLLSELVDAHRAVRVPISTAETNRERWILTEDFALYRAAFAVRSKRTAQERRVLRKLAKAGPCRPGDLDNSEEAERLLEKLTTSYRALKLPVSGTTMYVAANEWVPAELRRRRPGREKARRELIRRFLRCRGPVTKYEVMEHYGFAEAFVEEALAGLRAEGVISEGEYVPTKAMPQYCWKTNLEEIHRLTLARLRREMEPASAAQYADFLIRHQHAHPETRTDGVDGLRTVLRQLQGVECYQGPIERDILAGRVSDYSPAMLDRLCYGGEVRWRRFDTRRLRRGYIGFCFREDRDWLVTSPDDLPDLTEWDEDIGEECDAVRAYLAGYGACFFDDIVSGTGLDWRLVLRAVWHLVWTGEATNDSYESIRHADVKSGLSGCYDLASSPGKKGVTLDLIVRHMLDNRKLDPRLGRWAPTERLQPEGMNRPKPEDVATRWAGLLLDRWGFVTRDTLKQEVAAPGWRDVRRALVKMELLGKMRRGFFVEELAGEQYARPEAVEALRAAKLRDAGGGEPIVLLNACDPANPFGGLLGLEDAAGEDIRFRRLPTNYIILRAGRPLAVLDHGVHLLADLSPADAEEAMRLFTGKGPCHVNHWNGHPIDVSPARHLLVKLGFVKGSTRWKGYVYDGTHVPDDDIVAAAEAEMPETFERSGRERAPVEYDAEWVVSRSDPAIRPKVRELIERLRELLPDECEFVYRPRDMIVRYRGVRCIHPQIQRKRIYLQITDSGWVRGIPIDPDTALESDEFRAEFEGQFERTCGRIDEKLERMAERASA